MLLEDATTKSGHKDTWDVVKSSVARFTKRKQWLGDKEKIVSEPTPRPRVGAEDRQSRTQEPTAKKALDSGADSKGD
jgi:hypothetical protein